MIDYWIPVFDSAELKIVYQRFSIILTDLKWDVEAGAHTHTFTVGQPEKDTRWVQIRKMYLRIA